MQRRLFLTSSAAAVALATPVLAATTPVASASAVLTYAGATTPATGSMAWTKSLDEMSIAALTGEAAFPDHKLGVHMLLRDNHDKSLPAFALMEVNFTLPDELAGTIITALGDIGMRSSQTGNPARLIGAAARVRGNQFLFALSGAPDDTKTNRRLLDSRSWFDFAITHGDGRKGNVTLGMSAADQQLARGIVDSWTA